jgi:hypothetical protein
MTWRMYPSATLVTPVSQDVTATENQSAFCGTLIYTLSLISGKLDVIKLNAGLRKVTIDHRSTPLRVNQDPELYDHSYVGSHEIKLTIGIINSISYPTIPIPAAASGASYTESNFKIEITSDCTTTTFSQPYPRLGRHIYFLDNPNGNVVFEF